MGGPYLKWVTPEGREQAFSLQAEEITLGRKSDVDIILTDPYVSRHHAKLVRMEHGYSLVDLGSTHGCYVNGRRVSNHPLSVGDKIVLGKGRVELTFVVDTGGADQSDTTLEAGMGRTIMDLTAVLPSVYSGQSDLEKLSFILDFQYNLGRKFSAQSTFEQILASALKISGAERGFILLRAETGFQYVVGMDGEGHTISQSEFAGSQTVVRKVADSGEGVFMTEGIDEDLAHQDSIVALNLRALACMPLKWITSDSSSSAVNGILYLDSTKMMHALSGLDQKILAKLALEAGNVFEKVQMIEALEERKIIEKELALAQETQRTLLPQALPDIPGFRVLAYNEPTRQVGGDFYDFLNRQSDELTGVLADVSGKGVSAALVSSLLQGAMDMVVRSGVSFDEALTRLNRFLCQRSQSNRFVTLFLFNLNQAGSGTFVSAGHNPAYLFRSETARIDELQSDNMILGAFEHVEYSSSPLELRKGDIMVVYSDGLTEAEDPRGEMFGEERLKELILEEAPNGAAALNERILDSIEDFTEGRAQTDDITLLLVEKSL